MALCLSHVGGRGLQSSTLKAAVGDHEALLDSNLINVYFTLFLKTNDEAATMLIFKNEERKSMI